LIDIIIPSGNIKHLTHQCINSLSSFDAGMSFETIIVDNSDGEPFKLLANFKVEGIRIIRLNGQQGFAKAVNAGLKESKNEYKLILNNDTVIKHNNWLANLHKCFNHQEKIGIVSPTTNFIAVNEARCPGIEQLPNKYIETSVVSAVCWLANQKIIEDIGLMDEQFMNAFDDADYCKRVKEKGYKIFIDGFTFIQHLGSQTVSRTPGYYEAFQQSSDKFTKKWRK